MPETTWSILSPLRRTRRAIYLLVILCCNAAPAYTFDCLPPTPPFVPESDEAFAEYADVISADFERYFSEMSRYSTCLINAQNDLIQEGKAVSDLYEAFLDRARQLGVIDKAATQGFTSSPGKDER